jgi:beta-galactosidase
LWLHLDDQELLADGADSTRMAFGVADQFGAPRPFATGDVDMKVRGPAMVIGDNPFNLDESGGCGAVWLKTIAGRPGTVEIEITHPFFEPQSTVLRVV